MLRTQAVPRNYSQLRRGANVQVPGQPEGIPYVLFDTQTYTDNVTTSLSFFQTVQTDKTLGNLDQAGMIPAPNYFEIEAINLDFLTVNAAGVAPVGALNNILLLQHTGRGVLTFTVSGKEYLKLPITFLHPSGGAVAAITGTYAAGTSESHALGGPVDGGFYIGKSIILQPAQSFSARIDWTAAQDLTANVAMRLSLAGVYHRRVL